MTFDVTHPLSPRLRWAGQAGWRRGRQFAGRRPTFSLSEATAKTTLIEQLGADPLSDDAVADSVGPGGKQHI